jgi:hypothetical protein
MYGLCSIPEPEHEPGGTLRGYGEVSNFDVYIMHHSHNNSVRQCTSFTLPFYAAIFKLARQIEPVALTRGRNWY